MLLTDGEIVYLSTSHADGAQPTQATYSRMFKPSSVKPLQWRGVLPFASLWNVPSRSWCRPGRVVRSGE